MKTSPSERKAEAPENPPAAPADRISLDDGLDVWLLEESLAKTPWERMLANDDALRFADSLRSAMRKRNAEPQRTNTLPR
ncbi:MAG TPA: hypothetical protein P5205_00120 [Candidatus Paceibacterota bacterium]|nr:hypothetical protein [Verrucomicrobiota bacterium]HSA08756.1 hypothetical protein [Candidatus Paceibacterota bacterium]